ncbi:MAG: ABC transporter substrate-binding protein [Thermoanaerobaculia bacterium]
MRRTADDDSSLISALPLNLAGARAIAPALRLCFLLAIGFLPGACGRNVSGPVLHVVWSSDVLSLDPNQQFEFATDTLSMNVFEPLLRYDRKLSFTPVLAERWEITDGKTWRFHLRPGVKFHDGTPLSAEDVVFTVERIRSRPSSGLYPYLTGLTSIRAVDASTVEVISDRPAGLLSILSFVYILPRKLIQGRDEKAFFQHPIGTGPYRFERWVPQQTVWLEGFAEHRDGRPSFGKVVFLHLKEKESKWEAAKAHSPAIIFSPSRSTWKEHENDSAFRLVTRPGIAVHYLVCNMKPSAANPLADRRVREALHAAIDYPRLTEKVSGKQAFAASQYVTADIIGFNPSLSVPVFEKGKAARLLTEAGHAKGLDLTLSYIEGVSPLVDEVVVQLGESGVRVTQSPLKSATFYERVNRCETELSLAGWFCSTGDASELFEGNFGSSVTSARGGGPSGCGYGGASIDAAMDRIAKTLDTAARRDLLQQLMKRVVDDLPWIPLIIPYDRYALTAGLTWEPRGDGEIYLPDVKAN